MRVLYVSDLDGTLLNLNQGLNLSTIEKLNKLIDEGINFTISTGRGDSAKNIVNDINFKLPIMILNGSLNYDFTKKEYENLKLIPNKKVVEIEQKLKDFDFKKLEVQTIEKNELNRFSVKEWNKKTDVLAMNILFPEKKRTELSMILSKIEGINFFIHKKVYTVGECYCDIVKDNVSKASRLKDFKEYYGFDKVIAFGDSENDLPLADIADEFYAVENAVNIVKQRATGIIGSCFDDGVVNFIEKDSRKSS